MDFTKPLRHYSYYKLMFIVGMTQQAMMMDAFQVSLRLTFLKMQKLFYVVEWYVLSTLAINLPLHQRKYLAKTELLFLFKKKEK